MNNKTIVTAFGLLLSGVSAMAQDSAQGEGQISAVIRRPLSVEATRPLDFGTVFAGDNNQIVAAADAVKSAQFTVRGEADRPISVDFLAPSVVITKVGVGAGDPMTDMTVTAFEATGDVALNSIGEAVITVGAALIDNEATQAGGAYAGVFTVTVTQGQ